MESSEITMPEEPANQDDALPSDIPTPSTNGRPVRVDPDLEFIQALRRSGGDSLKKCMQCGNCSAACPLSPHINPFPRKEMAWALWGMKDHLLRDPDVWLCHHCNDCSTNCPRQTRPGDVLGAVRQQCILHYAFPGFLARWVSQPKFIPILLAIPAILLWLAGRYPGFHRRGPWVLGAHGGFHRLLLHAHVPPLAPELLLRVLFRPGPRWQR